MTTATKHETPTIPYPIDPNVTVFKDDGNWDKYPRWFLRPTAEQVDLHVRSIVLGHYVETGDPAYTHDEWVRKSAELVATYPGCIFVYTA